MEKVVIELPQAIEAFNGCYSSEKRQTALGYSVNGETISKEEAGVIIQKWFEHIKKLVPQTKLSSSDVKFLYEDTPEERQRRRKGLHTNWTHLDDPERIWQVTFLAVEWIVTGEDNQEIDLLHLELQIECGKQRAWLCGFGEDRFPEVNIDFPSWKEGVEKYFEIGSELLKKYGHEMEIPLPS